MRILDENTIKAVSKQLHEYSKYKGKIDKDDLEFIQLLLDNGISIERAAEYYNVPPKFILKLL